MKVVTTNLGQVISELFEIYQQLYHDTELASIATETTVTEILCKKQFDKKQLRQKQSRRVVMPAVA